MIQSIKGTITLSMSNLLKLDPDFKPAFDGELIASDLVNKLSSAMTVDRALLFGSSSKGKNTANSDLDILVVVPDGVDIKKYFKFVTAPHFSPVAVDWIFKSASDYTKEKDIGGVSMIATIEGKELLSGTK